MYQWRESKDELLAHAVGFGVIGACILVIPIFSLGGTPITLLIAFLLITVGLYKLLSWREPTIRRFVLLDHAVTSQVVTTTLQKRKIQFHKNAVSSTFHRFLLRKSPVQIQLQAGRYAGRYSPYGTFILIRPYTPEHKSHVHDLCHHIDKAFSPKGLEKDQQ